MNSLPFEAIKRTILVKKEAETSPKFGKAPQQRTVPELLAYGIIDLNKPDGPTSHQVTSYVKEILKVSKAGHSGTLDPGVTGVLPIAIGKATRIVQSLLTAGKEYICLMHLHKDVLEHEIRKVCSEFIGKIRQKPPLKSAVKRVEREREIYYFDILEIDGRDVLFKVGTQAGTYIRKLVHDIGLKIGGAHMQELRRTKAGPFNEDTNLVALQDLADAFWFWNNEKNEKYIRYCILPMEKAVDHLPKVWVMDTTVDAICHGASLAIPGIAKFESGINHGDAVAIMTLKNELVAVATAKMNSEEILQSSKGIVAISSQVFMEPGVYPKVQKSIS